MTYKVLIKKEAPEHTSETIYDVEGGIKFKVVSENGNAYSHLKVYVYTKNGDIACVATEYDIPNYKEVNFMHSAEERLADNRANLAAAEEYIKKVWEY
jgi:hypothetical protein